MLKRAEDQEARKLWRPEGVLVATFGEHSASINRVLPSPDHAFFITASDDGTIKVWDTMRLERNLAHRSRQTHVQSENAQVLGLAFVENTHTFASCASDGSIHVVKVDCNQIGDITKYGRLRLVRQYQLATGEYAVWVEHIRVESHSVLLMATNTSTILALDLRNLKILYTLENPVHHGTPTCFCVDSKSQYLVLGTSHGVLDLWDLRFRLRLKAWGLSGGTPIHRVAIHAFGGRGRWVSVVGGTGQTEITVWDLEKTQCREIYRASVVRNSRDNFKRYEAWKVDDEKPEAMLSRFATAVETNGAINGPDRGMRALAIGVGPREDGRDAKSGFYLTGGSDKNLRFWDIAHAERSMIVSGPEDEGGERKYTVSHPSTTLVCVTEKGPQIHALAKDTTGNQDETTRSRSKGPRTTVISSQQRALLMSHLDEIRDVCILERPVGMSISVDRKGVIYAFQ